MSESERRPDTVTCAECGETLPATANAVKLEGTSYIGLQAGEHGERWVCPECVGPHLEREAQEFTTEL